VAHISGGNPDAVGQSGTFYNLLNDDGFQ